MATFLFGNLSKKTASYTIDGSDAALPRVVRFAVVMVGRL